MNISILLMIIKNLLAIHRKMICAVKLKNNCPDDDQREGTRKITKTFTFKNGKQLTRL